MKLKNLTAIALTGMVCLSACTPQYTVEGKWADGAGKTVYLQKKVNDETPVIDSVVVAADGSFSFTLPAGVDVYELNAAKEAKKEILVSEIPVVVTIATELRTAKDSSTYETLSIEAVGDEQKVYEQGTQMIMTASFMQLGRMFALSNILQGKDTTMTLDSAVVFFDMMDARMNESIYNFVDSAKNNYGVAYFIKDYMIRSMPFDTVQVAYDALTDRVKQSAPGLELKNAVEALAAVSIGGTAPDITLMTPDSTELSLSSLRGHYVLLDFWASWCGPCMGEVPHLKETYDKFHKKGFEIYGVSFDRDRDKWLAAVKDNGMDWIHVSELQQFDNRAAKDYAVQGIPSNFLIDAQGVIVAKNLRGEDLYKKVEELLGK